MPKKASLGNTLNLLISRLLGREFLITIQATKASSQNLIGIQASSSITLIQFLEVQINLLTTLFQIELYTLVIQKEILYSFFYYFSIVRSSLTLLLLIIQKRFPNYSLAFTFQSLKILSISSLDFIRKVYFFLKKLLIILSYYLYPSLKISKELQILTEIKNNL